PPLHPLSLHDALPIWSEGRGFESPRPDQNTKAGSVRGAAWATLCGMGDSGSSGGGAEPSSAIVTAPNAITLARFLLMPVCATLLDRKSTRLDSRHVSS